LTRFVHVMAVVFTLKFSSGTLRTVQAVRAERVPSIAMRFDLISIFPNFFTSVFDYGILKRARTVGLVDIATHDLRAFTHDRHRTVDDRPFGGGEGMVLKLEPIYDAISSLNITHKQERDPKKETVILLSAQGQPFTQKIAQELATVERVVLICGRYEGVDERVSEMLCDRELSIGDYVLSGGELGAAVIVDAVVRLLPGALGQRMPWKRMILLTALRVRPTEPAEFSIIRTTPGRPSSAMQLFPTSFRGGTTTLSVCGGGRWPCARRCGIGPISWKKHPSARRTEDCCGRSRRSSAERMVSRHEPARVPSAPMRFSAPNCLKSCKLKTRVQNRKVVMSIHPIMQKLAAKLERTDIPAFAPGDTVRVQVKIREGEKERLQAFEGIVIACRKGPQGSFTVRKMSFGQGVERIFPYNSKVVDKVQKVRSYQVRRSKLFYLRGLRGKAARLREVERAS